MVAAIGASQAATPTAAEAFVGEGVVIDGATGGLTSPAQSIVTNPTFLATEPAEAAVAGDAATLLTAEGATGAAPVTGAVLPWLGAAAAVAVGSAVVCSVILWENCLEYFATEDDPAYGTGTKWSLAEKVETYRETQLFPGVYYTTEPSFFTQTGWTTHGCSSGSSPVPSLPSSASGVVTGESTGAQGCWVGESFNEWTSHWESARRSSAEGRGVKVAGPGAVGSTFTPKAGWDQAMGECLTGDVACGLTESERGRLGQKIASEISGSHVADPYAPDVTEVPDCDEVTWGACKAALEEVELEPVREDLDWSEVDGGEADEVQELQPAKATEVEKGSKVKVITNPGEEDMPVVVPPPEPGETYGHYVARLNPALSPERHDLDAPYISPSVGPNGVVSVNPEPESRLNPHTSHKLDVSTNPADAPMPAGAWVPPSIPGIDMSPLSGIPSPCSVFPFGLFCWIGEALSQFNVTGICPHTVIPTGELGHGEFDLSLCGSSSEQVMGYVRPFILLVFIVACGIMFARGTTAIGGEA